MKTSILCKKCKTQIGVEEKGRAKYYDRPGSYFFYNTIMNKNYGGEFCDDKYCKDCYEKISKGERL